MMKTFTLLLIILGCIFVPIVILLAIVWVGNWMRRRRAGRVPISERLLRPAGESLRVQIEDLNEKLGEALALAVIAPTAVLALVLLSRPSVEVTRAEFSAGLGVCFAAMAVFTLRALRIAAKRRDCLLGFHGERATAEEINQLMRDGCRVFHDVPNEPYGNIDHVIIAPSGVFAVETKTRRKKKAPAGKKDHEVIYDGKVLEFPNGKDTRALEQTRQQAERLRVFLTKAVSEPVAVSPILTFPGWFVTSRVSDGLKVVNPKQIRHVILNACNAKLAPELIKRISHQLDQICRDVEL